LRHAVATAPDRTSLGQAASALPAFFVELVDAGLDATAVSQTLALLYDDITRRLLALAIEECGAPPVDFAWLVMGSAARRELTLASDQDTGLAYAGTVDPAVDAYFARVAQVVTAGIAACGLKVDKSGVTAADPRWRAPLEVWRRRLMRCFASPNQSHIMGASIAFDCRQVDGRLDAADRVSGIAQAAPDHAAFLAGLGAAVAELRPPLGFRRRLRGRVDLKRGGLLPIVSIARYFALSHGLTVTSTLDRLAAVEQLDLEEAEMVRSLRSSFTLIADFRLRHHADLVRAGRPPDDEVDTESMPRIVRAGLQEALRITDESLCVLFPVLHGWV
jgi:CBS domain-containing protein